MQTTRPHSTTKTLFNALALNIISNLLLYAGHIIIARQLLPNDYATFTVVISFISIMALFADLGATSLFVRKFAEAESLVRAGKSEKRGELLGSLLALRLFLAIIVSLAVLLISPFLGYSAHERHLMLIMLVILFISSRIPIIRGVGESFLRGINKYHLVALFAGIDALVFSGLLFFYSGKTLDLDTAVWIYAFCHLPGFLLLSVMVYRSIKLAGFQLHFSFETIRTTLRQGLPLIFSTVFLTIHNFADPLLLDKLSTKEEVATFAAGFRVLTALVFIPVVFAAVISPIVTRAVTENTLLQVRGLLDRSLRLLVIISTLVALVISSASGTMIHLLFGGDKYIAATNVVILFGWSFIPIFLGNFLMEIAVAEGKLWLSAFYMATLMVSALLFDFFLIPHYGALGSAIAKTAGVSLGAIVLLLFAKRLLVIDRRSFFRFMLKIIIIIGISITLRIALLNTPLHEGSIAVIISCFFILASFLSKAISIQEVLALKQNLFSKR